MTLKLYQFPPRPHTPNFSPFCLKLETFLRLFKIPYEMVPTWDLKRAPKGKLPYIEDGHGKLGDTGFIIDYLCRKYNLDPDAALTAEQRAVSQGLRRMCEEALFWQLLYSRWGDPAAEARVRKVSMPHLPGPIRRMMQTRVMKHFRRAMRLQGTGLHSRDEIYHLAKQDVQALADFLGEKPFFFGYTPTLLDVTVFAMLLNVPNPHFDNPLRDFLLTKPNLLSFIKRMLERCFPEYVEKLAG